MNIRNKISDYEENKEDADKWLLSKGEDKYSEILHMVEKEGFETSWDNVSGLYRYDKRLSINNSKYLSFFEEYCRAWLIRECGAPYDKTQELPLYELIREMSSSGKLGELFDSEDPETELHNIRKLRNTVSHNRIVLTMTDCDYETAVQSLYNLLPESHKEGYAKILEDSRKNIPISIYFGYIPK